jgi:hypothetical protein
MINDVDAAVEALIRDAVGPDVPVSLDPPGPGWDRHDDGPVVDLCLAEIRDDPSAGWGDWTDVRDDTGRVIARRPPVRRYRFTYVISARAREVAVEHDILGRVLQGLAGRASLPQLGGAGLPVILSTAPADRDGRLYEHWTAFGCRPRPALIIEVCLPLIPDLVDDLGARVEAVDLATASSARPGATRSLVRRVHLTGNRTDDNDRTVR